MDKLDLLIIILVIIIVALLATFLAPSQVSAITGLVISSSKTNINNYSFTKAICDENNLCQDHVIVCENQEQRSITPITGAVVQFDQNWQDPRSLEQIEKLCGG